MNNLAKEIKNNSAGREIYIWGAGNYGAATKNFCEKNDIKISGFIDKNFDSGEYSEFCGLAVYGPNKITDIKNKPYILLGVHFDANNTIEKNLNKNFYIRNQDYFLFDSLYHYWLEIVDFCNLKCPSCPRGNSVYKKSSYTIPLERFKIIIDKILTETPQVFSISLFNWGEPLLHPHLDSMIRYLNEKGIFSILSSNLSILHNLDNVIKSNPGWLKVSLSGYYQAAYATTHTGGNINIVKSNLYRIKALIEKKRLTTQVEVGYHKYRNNCGDDYMKMKELCNELGFYMHSVDALLAPAERVLELIRNKEVKHWTALEPLIINTAPYRERKPDNAQSQIACHYQNRQIMIDPYGRVSLCCAVFDESGYLDVDYLHSNLTEITKKKNEHPFCRLCKSYHLACFDYGKKN